MIWQSGGTFSTGSTRWRRSPAAYACSAALSAAFNAALTCINFRAAAFRSLRRVAASPSPES
jgi:hypothetical protein